MNIASHKKTILIMIVVLAVFFGYWFFFLSGKGATTAAPANVVSQTSTSGSTQYDKEFVSSLLGLNSVDLNVSIFQSRTYIALSYPEVPFVVNYSKDAGRNNPFLPIGLESSGTVSVQNQVKPAATTPVATTATTVAPTASTTPPATTTAPKPTPKKF